MKMNNFGKNNVIGGSRAMGKGVKIVLRQPKILVHCPFCGKYLLTLGFGEAERECIRCHNYLIAINDDEGFRLLRNRRCAV